MTSGVSSWTLSLYSIDLPCRRGYWYFTTCCGQFHNPPRMIGDWLIDCICLVTSMASSDYWWWTGVKEETQRQVVYWFRVHAVEQSLHSICKHHHLARTLCHSLVFICYFYYFWLLLVELQDFLSDHVLNQHRLPSVRFRCDVYMSRLLHAVCLL